MTMCIARCVVMSSKHVASWGRL